MGARPQWLKNIRVKKLSLGLVLGLALGGSHSIQLVLRPPAAHEVVDILSFIGPHVDVARVHEVQGVAQRVEPKPACQLDSLIWGGGVNQLLHLAADPPEHHGVHSHGPAQPIHDLTPCADLYVRLAEVSWEVCRPHVEKGGGDHRSNLENCTLVTEIFDLDHDGLDLGGPEVLPLLPGGDSLKMERVIFKLLGESTYR